MVYIWTSQNWLTNSWSILQTTIYCTVTSHRTLRIPKSNCYLKSVSYMLMVRSRLSMTTQWIVSRAWNVAGKIRSISRCPVYRAATCYDARLTSSRMRYSLKCNNKNDNNSKINLFRKRSWLLEETIVWIHLKRKTTWHRVCLKYLKGTHNWRRIQSQD